MGHGELLDQASKGVELLDIWNLLYLNVVLPIFVAGSDHFLCHLLAECVKLASATNVDLTVLVEHLEGSLDALVVPALQVLLLPRFEGIGVLLRVF